MAKRNARPGSRRQKPRRRKKKPAGSGTPQTPKRFALVPATLSTKHPDATKQKAIEGFLEHGTVRAGCAVAGIGRTTWYEWRQNDPEFNRLANEAEEHVTDELEEIARLRASMPEGSDTLLIFLLKARRRAIYGDKNTLTLISPEVQVRVQTTIQTIASKPQWDSEELINVLAEVWK